jgi:sporulation-control protein spo0M
MGFLKAMGVAVGVGNLEVTASCDEELYQGEEVKGVATITGGEVPQIVQGLVLSLVYQWEVRDEGDQREGEGAKVVHHRAMPLHLEVAPGSTHRVPFVLDIPTDLPLAEAGDWHSVAVTADIPHAVDVTGSRRVSVGPIRPIADALRAITLATKWTLQGYEPRKADPGFVRAVLAPSPAAAARFDGLILEIAVAEGAMRVLVTVDMKEGFWKELTGGDKHDYSFAASDIPSLVTSLQELIHKHGG